MSDDESVAVNTVRHVSGCLQVQRHHVSDGQTALVRGAAGTAEPRRRRRGDAQTGATLLARSLAHAVPPQIRAIVLQICVSTVLMCPEKRP